ncbi:MAG: hypothetical protein ACYCO5_05610 [Acidobacteriaceae bacterium]
MDPRSQKRDLGHPAYVNICDRPKIGEMMQQFPDMFQQYKGE